MTATLTPERLAELRLKAKRGDAMEIEPDEFATLLDVASREARMRTCLEELIAAFVNPGDGGPFEDGEVPALDRARAALKEPGYE